MEADQEDGAGMDWMNAMKMRVSLRLTFLSGVEILQEKGGEARRFLNSRGRWCVLRTMHSLRSLLGAAVLAAGTCFAAEPSHDLDPQAAVKLIDLLVAGHQSRVEIALIVDGTGKAGPFEATHVRRVVAVHPVWEDGRTVRRMRIYDFYWNETYGWFTWEKREERGGDAVYIWSELKGAIIVS